MDQWICTPFFIAKPEEMLREVAGDDQIVNAPALGGDDALERMGVLYRHLADHVASALAAGKRPVSLAGDCVSSLGVIAGLQRAGIDASLLWLDAHGDFNTWETSPSGFLGGMPLAMAVGRGDQRLVDTLALTPIDEVRVILCDARDLDPGEREAVAASGVTHIANAGELLERALPPGPVYVHFDSDIVDAAQSPAQNYPVAGGPSGALLERIFRHIGRCASVVALSVSAWNPKLAGAETSRAITMAAIRALLESGEA